MIVTLVIIVAPVSAATFTISPGTPDVINTTINLVANSGDTIILNPGTYFENNVNVSKDIIIEANTANGGSPANTIIDGNTTNSRIFNVTGAYSLTIDSLTLRNGNTADGGGAISSTYSGSAVIIEGSSVITNCSASNAPGGAINSGGSVTMTSSTITDCSAPEGGAIASAGSVTVTSSTITNCSAPEGGGAIYAGGWVTLTSSTITNCSAPGGGGAIYSGSPVTVTSSTITNCSASNEAGGAIYAGMVDVTSSTITGCSDPYDGSTIYSGFGGTLNFNRLYDNTGSNSIMFGSGSLNATYNWWGSNNGPSGSSFSGSGPITYTPWLVLGATAAPSSISLGQTSAIQINLTYNSTGFDTSGSGLFVPNGIPVTFTIPGGTGSVQPSSGETANGLNTTTFTPATTGTTIINAMVDGQQVSAVILISATPGSTPLTAVQQSMVTVSSTAPPTTTEPPLPANTPWSGLDAVPVLGAFTLCGAIFLFRKKGA